MSGNSDFGTFGRYQATPVEQMPEEKKAAYDYTLKLRGLVPGPHKIWLANPTLSQTIVPTGADHQTALPLGMFRRARDLLGDAGIVDVAALMGWFTTVSLTLMAYDVPANAVGMEQ